MKDTDYNEAELERGEYLYGIFRTASERAQNYRLNGEPVMRARGIEISAVDHENLTAFCARYTDIDVKGGARVEWLFDMKVVVVA